MEQPDKKKYHDLLIELMDLKDENYDKFMEKLYEAIFGEFKGVISDKEPVTEKKKALNTMMLHFQSKEAYEKCAQIKQLAESLTHKQ